MDLGTLAGGRCTGLVIRYQCTDVTVVNRYRCNRPITLTSNEGGSLLSTKMSKTKPNPCKYLRSKVGLQNHNETRRAY